MTEWTVETLKQLSDERREADRRMFDALRASDEHHHEMLRAADKLLHQEQHNSIIRHSELALSAHDQAKRDTLIALGEVAKERERANEKRFDSVNEFRSQLKDQAGTFLTRTEYEATQRNVSGDRLTGRSDVRGTVTLIIAIAAFAITTLANFGSLILR